MRKGRGKTDNVRERLVDAAVGLFDERGFDSTPVGDIAERAGVSRTTFSRHFGSKEQVIFPDHDGLLAVIRSRLAASRPNTATVAVSEAARGVLKHYVAEGGRARERYALTRTVPALRDHAMVEVSRRFDVSAQREAPDSGTAVGLLRTGEDLAELRSRIERLL